MQQFIAILAAFSFLVLSSPAATLGDALRKKANEPETAAVASVRNGLMQCSLQRVELVSKLVLPDCAFGSETYTAPESCVLLLVCGEARNEGAKSVHFQLPKFVDARGRHFDSEDIVRYKDEELPLMGASLNPGRKYRFVCFFIVPVDSILGGALEFEKDLFCLDDEPTTLLKLPLTEESSIAEQVVLEGVTDM